MTLPLSVSDGAWKISKGKGTRGKWVVAGSALCVFIIEGHFH